MVLGRGGSARSSRQGWEPDWSRVGERAVSGERDPAGGRVLREWAPRGSPADLSRVEIPGNDLGDA